MASTALTYQKLLTVGTKIIAVGRNYAAHAKELGNAVPKEPVLFLKPTTSYLENGGTIEVPERLEALDHEVELAVVIGKRGRDVPEAAAADYIGGYALALDMTAREIQSAAKSAGLPWSVAKGQDTFTPISSILPKSMVPDPHSLELWLKVDGEIRQKGSTGDMMFKIPFLISHISSIFTLLEGDVILTGTPQGVGPVKIGQKIEAGITGLLDVQFDVGRRHKLQVLMESNTIDESQDAGNFRRRKGKAVDTRVSAKWTDANIAALIEACAKEVRAGNRPRGSFNHIGWVHVVEDFKLKTGNNYTKQQLKNQLDTLKEEWIDWTILNRGETGLGWDDIQQTVSAEPEWWSRKIQETPAVAKFRLKGPLLKELQAELFDGVVATGLWSFAPSSGNIPFIEQIEEGSGETVPQWKSSLNRAKKNKSLRSAESIAKSLHTIAVNDRMRLEARTKRSSDDIDECMASLHAHPGIVHGSQIWFFAIELFADPTQRSLYMGIPTADLRLQWLEKKLARDKITNPSLYTHFDPFQ